MRHHPFLAAMLLLSGCSTLPASPGQPLATACPITASSDWHAWVNAMPGPGAKPTLIVVGKVTVPTGGYRFDWGDWRVMESYPVQVAGELIAIPPAEGATQAVVTQEVRGSFPIDPPVGSLAIRCGERELVRIAPGETAH